MKQDESLGKKKAVALQYDSTHHDAPSIKAKGTGQVAEKIMKMAEENSIPIQKDPALVEILSKLEIDQQIPPELYEVVAEILAMVYQLEQKAMNNEQRES
jgi:flagellar biosynthesis protein